MGRFAHANRKLATWAVALLLSFAASTPQAFALPNTIVNFASPAGDRAEQFGSVSERGCSGAALCRVV